MLHEIAVDALINITLHIIFIVLSWKSLEALNFEKIIKKNKVVESRLIFILLSIAIGSIVSNFVINFIHWSRQLVYLF
ncbi:DUF1146 family protein [Bacillaceae bacterium W0354]